MAEAGDAAVDPPKQSANYLIYWRKPEEWATIIYDWVSDNGFLNTIMTFYEIVDGDLSQATGKSPALVLGCACRSRMWLLARATGLHAG